MAPASYAKKDNIRNVTSVQQLALNNVEIPHQDDIVEMPEIRESDAIRFDIDKIKVDVKNSLQVRQELQARIADHKASEQSCAECLPQLQGEKKMKERTQLLLENPEENMTKLIKILATAQERMKKLQDQWDEHRIPLEQQIQTAQQNNSQYVCHGICVPLCAHSIRVPPHVHCLHEIFVILVAHQEDYGAHQSDQRRNGATGRETETKGGIARQAGRRVREKQSQHQQVGGGVL